MALKIITDSASDIPKSIKEEFNLHVIPTPVVIDGTDYFDGETIQPETFYDILRSGKDIKTYHINSYMFHENFEPYAKNGDEVIYVCFSTGIAGTFNAANLAKTELLEEYPDFDLTIIDSKCASAGFGIVVYMALLMQRNGADKQTIIDAIQFHCAHIEHMVTVETLEYLLKGGRISRTSAIAGGLLDIKPIIEVNKDGALVAFEKVRGRKKSLHRVLELVGIRGEDLKNQIVGIVHGDDKETLKYMEEKVRELYGVTRFVENYVGCAIGAHTGPGVIGVVFLNTESPYKKWFL
ncbi:DegV family protein [Anaerolentibacter hominis]|uniref:DegV family protein n=1 Tax=Anaerolentibacter hominis TaxID=3079009 RepID=UPI0031B8795F